MDHREDRIRELAEALGENLRQCAKEPEEEAVHGMRTGTRRLEAELDTVGGALPSGRKNGGAKRAIRKLRKLLKKVRRPAGDVRDLDVHRKLLKNLVKWGSHFEGAGETVRSGAETLVAPRRDLMAAPQEALPQGAMQEQADTLDDALTRRRRKLAAKLSKRAGKWQRTLAKRAATLEKELEKRENRRHPRPAAELALERFVDLSEKTGALDAGNLHDFRKGAKKARYVTESSQEKDREAAPVGDALKELQDAIGDWHDFLLLAEEARKILGKRGLELRTALEAERERHFVVAIKTANRLRGMLLGEWRAVARKSGGKKTAA